MEQSAVRTTLKWTGIVLATLVLLLAVALLVFDWNWIKDYVARSVSGATGRSLSIEGDLDVRLGWTTRVRIEKIRFENAAWSNEPHMVELAELRVSIKPWELLWGNVVLPEVELKQPVVVLEKSADGQPNWEFTPDPASQVAIEATTPEERGDLPLIGRLGVEDGRIVYRDQATDTEINARIETIEGETQGAERRLHVEGEGRFEGQAFEATLDAGSLLALRETENPYPIAAELRVGEDQARVEGTLIEPVQLTGVDLRVGMQGPDPARWLPLPEAPALRPYRIEGRVLREEALWQIQDLHVVLGEGELTGQVAADLSGEAPALKTEFAFHDLDFGDVVGEIRGERIGALSGEGQVTVAGSSKEEMLASAAGRLRLSSDKGGLRQVLITVTAPADNRPQRLAVEGEAVFEEQPLQFRVGGGSLPGLFYPKQPYPLVAEFTAGDTRARAEGTLIRPLELAGFDLTLALAGPDPAKLFPIIGIPLPSLPPYRIQGRLSREGTKWKLTDFDGHLGDSDLAGDVDVDIGHERLYVWANLTSDTLDPDDFAGIAAAEESESDEEVVSDEPIDTERLRAIDATVRFQGHRIIAPQVPLEDLSFEMKMRDGQLVMAPLAFAIAGGSVRAKLVVEAAKRPLRSSIEADLESIDVNALAKSFGATVDAVDTISGSVAIAGNGWSFADFIASADGSLDLTLGGSRLEQLTMDFETVGKAQRIVLDGSGRLTELPFRFNVKGGPLQRLLQEEGKPYPLEAEVVANETRLRVDGTLARPRQFEGVDMDVLVEGPDPERLFPVFGIPVPSLPPYRVAGRLTRQGAAWKLRNLDGVVGDSDLAGTISVDLSGKRPRVEGDLTSRMLDFDDLLGAVGAPPDTGAGETASPEQRQEAAAEAADGRVLPDKPLDLARLRAADGELKFRGQRVIAPGLPLDDLAVNLTLEDGKLVMQPLDFGVAGGNVRSNIVIRGDRQPVQSSIRTEIERVNLKEILRDFEIADDSVGIIGGRAELQGSGTSVAKFLASVDGRLALIMTGGQLDSVMVELAGLDIGETLISLFTDTEKVTLHCAVVVFKAQNGVMNTDTLVIDTSDTLIVGQGKVDFRDESLQFALDPRAKDASLLAAPSTLKIGGTFQNPTGGPDVPDLIVRGLASAALGVLLTPAGALLPLIEPGTGEDSDCQALVNRARRGS